MFLFHDMQIYQTNSTRSKCCLIIVLCCEAEYLGIIPTLLFLSLVPLPWGTHSVLMWSEFMTSFTRFSVHDGGRQETSLFSCFVFAGSLHQSEREEECVSEYHESGRPAEGVLLYILKQRDLWPSYWHIHRPTSEASPRYTRPSRTGQDWIWSSGCILMQCVSLVGLRTDSYWLHKAIGPPLHNVNFDSDYPVFLVPDFFSPFIDSPVLFLLILLRILHCLSTITDENQCARSELPPISVLFYIQSECSQNILFAWCWKRNVWVTIHHIFERKKIIICIN